MTLTERWTQKRMQILLLLYIVIAIVVALQSVLLPPKQFFAGGGLYTHYNNYQIFKYSWRHLITHQDLYHLYPSEYWDLYKYSPAFAVFFSLFSWMPDFAGLTCWNLLNTLVFFAGIKYLPNLTDEKKSWILLFCVTELVLSTQNSQSNALIAGMIMIAFALLERSKYFLATLLIVFTVYIKLFGAVAFVLYLFYPGKLKLMAYTIFWMIAFALLPAIVVDFNQLIFLYKSWWQLLADDHSISIGISAMGIAESWFHMPNAKTIIFFIGLVSFCIPLLHWKRYNDFYFRALMLSSVLLWIVIFNHKAESPTFIIAMAGIGIGYFIQQKNKLNLILLLLAFVFTALISTDLCPGWFKERVIKPYNIKALFPVIIWFKLSVDLIFLRYRPAEKRPALTV